MSPIRRHLNIKSLRYPCLVFLTPRYQPDVGGVETHVEQLVSQLAKRGYRVFVITTQPNKGIAEKESTSWGKIIRLPSYLVDKKIATWWWILKKFSIFYQADLIQVHDIFWWLYPLYPLLKLWGKPIFTTFHGYESVEGPGKKVICQRKLVTFLSTRSLCIGSFIEKWYCTRCDQIAYGAVSTGRVVKNQRRMTNSAIFVGRLAPENNLTVYLEAIKKMSIPFRMHVFGDGPEFPVVQQIIKSDNLPVKLFGWTTDIEIQLQKHRYAFVNSYLAILEAMLSKCLVVAIYQTTLKKDYLCCHPMASNMVIVGSAEQLVNEVASLTQEEEGLMVERAHQWARQQSWSALADQYELLWNG